MHCPIVPSTYLFGGCIDFTASGRSQERNQFHVRVGRERVGGDLFAAGAVVWTRHLPSFLEKQVGRTIPHHHQGSNHIRNEVGAPGL